MLGLVLSAVAIVVVTSVFSWVLNRLIARRVASGKADSDVLDRLGQCRAPAITVVVLIMTRAYEAVLESVLHLGQWVGMALNVALMLALGWLVVRVAAVLMAIVAARVGKRVSADPQRLQRIHTQLSVFETAAAVIIWLATLIFIMLTFPATRPIATSLFASASLLSLVIGIAAQGTLGSFFAGLQIAFGDIVRIGDTVVVDGQQGVVEEIALTYVVVKRPDYRRLVVPVTFFTTKSFENWTRRHLGVLAETFVNVDLTTPVPEVREKVREILDASTLWDRTEWSVSVAEPQPNTQLLRLKISAAVTDAADAGALCAEVRGALQEHLAREIPSALPATRETSVPNPALGPKIPAESSIES
ncbi:mechanosensitive ion channel family protein [Nocardia huaxiensis]|uniref:Mechanosensitive ion channel n=1 Tax=Nocardia huaxiensis TaxID=2755382 RepID=A0A7D6ZKN7_9NOCA|nr:mechanosensitive ion channel domain-containing protein [Nocardia huaxiensis]QLY33519.1 mechanosensitive ion channel [Nocardia huaxiensis]UFS99563.1 mechanosensitive ion channel [Nocardia huaxiensis]